MHLDDTELAGIELKVLRIRAGVRQYRVAQVLGIPPATLCAWENGRAPLPPGQASRVEATIRRLAADGGAGGDGDAQPA